MAEAAMAASHLKDPALAAGSCHSGDGGGGRQCSLRRLSGLGFRTKRKETLSPSSSRAASSSPFFWTCHCSSSSFPPNLLLQVLFLILVCFALPAASHADGTTCLNVEQKPPKRFLYDTAELRILPLVLDSSERITHRVTTEILKILLQEILGYQNVTIKVFKDVFNMTANLGRLSAEKSGRGKQPVGMINIEVWVPPGVGRADHTLLDAIDCGPHRSGGRFGWYVTKNNDTETKIADYWRSFKKMSVASLLALTNEEEELVKKLTVNPNGEYYCQDNCDEGIFKPPLCREGKDCATLFVRDYEASSFLRDQILRLQLMIQVAWIGPNLTPHFVRTFRGSKAILFFDWWPNEFSNLQGFLPVAFAQSSEFLKKYELHSLNKFVWKKLQSNGKTAVELTQRMVFNEMDYRFILQRYTSITANMTHPLPSKRNDALINSIACEWLQKNKSVWLGWRPQDYNRKTTLWVGGIFPMTGPSFESRTLLRPAQMAQHKINLDPNILPDVKFEILASNGKCKSDDVLRAFISYIRMDNTNPKYKFNNMVGILGPACSDTVEPLAGVALHFHTVIISYSAEGAIFNDKNKYPFFFRTIPENRLFRFVYLQIFQRNNWKKVASLSEDGNKYSEYLTLLENVLERFNITIFNRRFPRNLETSDKSDVNSYLTSLKKNNHRIIIGDFYASKARLILCEAYKRNMTIKHGFVVSSQVVLQ